MKAISEIREQPDQQNGECRPYSPLGDVLALAFDKIEEVYRTKNRPTGIPSGFCGLDDITAGFQPANLAVIGSRPSVGKTTIALNMAAHIAIRECRPTAFFSLEMTNVMLAQRLISGEALVDVGKMRNGLLPTGDFRKITDVIAAITEAPLFMADRPNIKLRELCSRIRELRARESVEIVFIDYLGLIDHEDRSLPRHEQVSEFSRALKSLATELKIPIVVLCQLNREMERSAHSRPPSLANIRDSGSIEQDADLVMLLHGKPPSGNEKDGIAKGIPAELIVAKHRNGPVGTVELVLQQEYLRFVPLQRQGGLS